MVKAPKRSKSDIKAVDLNSVVQQYIVNAVNINYREAQQGAMNKQTLTKWLEFLAQLPGVVNQKPLEGTLKQWAIHNESTWHLAGEANDWSARTARKIRAMRKDVSNCINKKPHRPKWFTEELQRLQIDIKDIDVGYAEDDEIGNVASAIKLKAESKPQETEKAARTAQSVTAEENEPVLSQTRARAETTAPSDCGGKFIYKFDEDCQAHSYG